MDEQQIKVVIRLRKQIDESSCLKVDLENQILLDSKPMPKLFQFDNIVQNNESQEEIFNIVGKPILQNCLDGFNSTIFAYGQTGTGKTYTMCGKNYNFDDCHKGLQQRILEQIIILKCQSEMDFQIKCQYFEIFNEQVYDLLSQDYSQLQIRENIDKGVYLDKITEVTLINIGQSIDLLKKGNQMRQTASHAMNSSSSRSHTVFQLTIEQKFQNQFKVSKLNLVDLAGSERQKKAQTEGLRLKEASNINKSLSVLGNVINALADKTINKSKFIPYRDSKLTFILKESLGGNSKTLMIATINTDVTEFQETLSTLKFAQRVKQIKQQAQQNFVTDNSISELQNQISDLKQQIVNIKSQNLENLQLKDVQNEIQNQQKFQKQIDIQELLIDGYQDTTFSQQLETVQNKLDNQQIKNEYLEQKLFDQNQKYGFLLEEFDTLYQSFQFQKDQYEQLKYQYNAIQQTPKKKEIQNNIKFTDIQILKELFQTPNYNIIQKTEKANNNLEIIDQDKENNQNIQNIQNLQKKGLQKSDQKTYKDNKIQQSKEQSSIKQFFTYKKIKF